MRSHLRRSGKRDIDVRRVPVFAHKTVLVTGAGGSIGSALCNQIMMEDAKRLILVSLTEAGLYNIERSLRKAYSKYRDTKLVPVLGDFGDPALMHEVLQGVDTVIHAGAHKHVPICESNPIAAIKNNVMGTMLFMEEANKAGIRQFCAVSSDKAVKPASIMGATKRAVELICAYMNNSTMRTFAVRFGNVMDSAGSVLPLWREQIMSGGPLTLTDVRCERYFMSVSDAVTLIGNVIALKPDGGVYVFDMGAPRKIMDIAREMIQKCGRRVEIETIGLRKGEKVREELNYGGTLQSVSDRINKVIEQNPPPLNVPAFRRMITAVHARDSAGAVKSLWELVA